MKALLTLSNSNHLSHIATITQIDDDLLNFLKNYKNKLASSHIHPMKEYILSSLLNKDYYTQIGERADFTPILKEKDILFMLNFDGIKHISFAVKDEDKFIYYDYEDFINEYSFEDFKNLLFFIQAREEKNKQGEDNVRNTSAKQTHRPLTNADHTTKQLQRDGTDESFKRPTHQTNFKSERDKTHTKDKEDDTDFNIESSKNEFNTTRELLQTNSTPTQSEDKRTSQELRWFNDRDGFSDKLQARDERRAAKENAKLQSPNETDYGTNQTLNKQSHSQSLSNPRSEGIKPNRARYDTTRLRTRINALLQSEFTRSFINENIQSSLELFRAKFGTKNLQSISKLHSRSNRINQREQMGANSESRKTNTNDREWELGIRETFRQTRGIRSTDEQANSPFKRLDGELGGGDANTTGFVDTEFNTQRRGLFNERIANSNANTQSSPTSSQNLTETKEFSNPISQEFSNSFNESYQASLEKTDPNTEIQKREPSKLDIRTSDRQSQQSLRAKQQELRTKDETEFLLDDGRISTSPTTKQDSPNEELSQSQASLSTFEEPTWQSNEQGTFADTNTEFTFTTQGVKQEEPSLKELKEDENFFIPELKPSQFKIFKNHHFLKKLDGENYKINKELNLNTKERIKANYEALKLTQLIFNQGRITATSKEQELLAQFSGYGGLKALFYDEKYSKEKDELLELVGAKYFKELQNSAQTAFYTPNFLIQALYERLFKLGVSKNEKIKVLEPSCGTGKFMSLAPANFEFEAVEKDALTATIAKFLHPKVVIHNKGLEEVHFNKEFDLVVGNPPYAKESVYDLNSQGHKESLHNYFTIKGAELLKENGLLSFVISSYFLDSKEAKHRNILNSMGTFIDTYRLSSEVFKDAQVLSDLIFYGKRKFSDKELRAFNYQTQQIIENFTKEPINYDEDENSPYHSRIYENNENVLGKLSLGTNQWGLSLELRNKNIEQDLKDAIKDSPEIEAFKNNAPYENKALTLIDYDSLSASERILVSKLKNGNMFLMGNKIYIKKEDDYCEEAYFEDSLPLEKKYLISASLIIAQQKKNFTYKNYLNEEELKIATKLCVLRDKLAKLLRAEKSLDDSLISNEFIMKLKTELRTLREEILTLANIKSFNQTNKRIYDKEDRIITHNFKDILFLDKLASYELLALEEKKDKAYTLAPILFERIAKPFIKTLAKTEEEALLKTLSDKGKIDLESLQSYLPSKNLEQILYTLLEKRLIFHSIEEKALQDKKTDFSLSEIRPKATYELAEQFLKGNVKKKHAQIKAMIANKESFTGLSLPLEEVLKELEKVFPAYVNYEDIHINFGSNFIASHIYEKFIEDTFFKNKALVSLKRMDGAFYFSDFCVEEESFNADGVSSTKFKEAQLSDLSELATNLIIYNEEGKLYFEPKTFVERVLNNKSIEVFHYEPHPDGELNNKGEVKKIRVNEPTATKIALEKKEELIGAFESYLFNNKNLRDEIEKEYNDKINVYTMNKNSYAKFFSSPNLSKNKKLREHQKNVVFKGIIENSLLLDHQVGAGKTLAGVCIVMEQLRMGLIQKALILVPNHLTNQWQKEFTQAYSNVRILVGDKISDKKDRKEFLHRIKYGAYEVVIMKHSTFENLNVLESYEKGVYYDYIENLKENLRKMHNENIKDLGLSSKELSKAEKKLRESIDRKIKILEKKLEKKAKGKEFDNELAFEDLGFDLVMVDEAHHFKNLLINTNQDNIRGLGTADSAKAMKMYCVSKFIHENKHKFYFLTGTPVSNSIAEFFIMQKYLQPEVLENLGLSHFDDWQRTFTQIVDSEELDSSGVNYKIVSRLSQFVNAPELMATYLQNADVVSIEDVEKAEGKRLTPSLKEGKVINVIAPRSEEIASYIGIENEKGEYNKGSIIWRMDNIQDDPQNNNMLKCTSDARKAALDFRLIDNNASDYEESKINQMCKRILNHYEDKNYPNNTQLIFCDMGVSKKHSQSIDPNEEQISSFKSLEKLKEELELVLEYDEESGENFYAKYEYEDEKGKKLKKAKLIKKYSIEELLELSGNSFDVYADILKKLVKLGILQKEIAFISDANTDKQKQDLFDRFNTGELRVLIGSTMKMGAGTNVQKKVVALHELDCPWRPCDLEQRQGRVIRQGNEWFEKDESFCIAHYRYSTEQTYDARMFQVNEQKLKPLVQLKQCDFSNGQRNFNSIDSELASVAEMKAYATGNPFILEKHKISTLLKSEQRHYETYKKTIMQNERALEALKEKIMILSKEQAALREMVHNKDFEKENYALEAFGVKSYKKCKNKADEEDYKNKKKLINFSIKEVFLYPKADEELEILKANGITLVLKGRSSIISFIYQGIMKFDTGESYMPNNLIFKADNAHTFYTIPELDGLLERIKNNFHKASENLNKISTLLKNTEAEIKIKEDFLSKNGLNTYPKKILLDTLKKDEKNMNEIFILRNELRKKGIKLEMNSKEIKHLLPQYTQFFNEKGKFDLNLIPKKEIEQKSLEQKAKELKDAVLGMENVEIDFKIFDEKDSLKVKVNTLLSNQENISKSIRARDILR